ncbi:MAG: hypothetical protein IT317_17050 [Anaerolineales bacterium]|nr:hypothetical protein [Anaerolineales bacterium]
MATTRSRAVRLALAALLLAALACAFPGAAAPTPTPTALVTTSLGAFDCTGSENGLLAYAGRLTFAPAPDASWQAQGETPVTGQYDYDPASSLFTFGGGFVFDSAIYDANTDTLVATVTPGTTLAHAEGGSVTCVRAQPGITGPG